MNIAYLKAICYVRICSYKQSKYFIKITKNNKIITQKIDFGNKFYHFHIFLLICRTHVKITFYNKYFIWYHQKL